MFLDPLYFVFLAPAILLSLWAQFKVKSAYNRASQIAVGSGVSGAEAAGRILRQHGLSDVGIEISRGFLSDHYDPRHKVLRLSPDVYHGRSLAAVGIAAHEAGHALQDAQAYAPLAIRNAIVPMANFGSNLSFLLIIVGIIIGLTQLAWVGIALFSTVVVFQLVNLPIEFNASSRARAELLSTNIVSAQEDRQVKKVLSAAALTYVAATLTAILTLLYFLSLMGRR